MAQHHEERTLGPNRVDQEQYALLKQCADAGDATAWNEWRRENPDAAVLLQGIQLGSLESRAVLRRIDLHGANLARAKLTGAILVGADLRGAVLVGAALHSAILVDADLRDAHLLECDLCGANLRRTDLRGTQTAYAKVDGETLLLTDRVDPDTDFTGVPLDAMRIEPGLPQLLAYNVRRERWRQWYRRHRALAAPAWLFWTMCDYGHSTWRVLLTFSMLAVVFAAAYRVFPDSVVAVWSQHSGEPFPFTYALYFSIVTMTTLGFGDVYAAPDSALGQFLLSFQVVLGYVLLGALVTRFAVLFTAGGPSVSFYREPKPEPPPAAPK